MGVIYSSKEKEFFKPKSIDNFIGNGIIDAAERTGIDVHRKFKSYFQEPGDKREALKNSVSKGNTTAYLIYMVSDSFKRGVKSNRVSVVLGHGNKKDIVQFFETLYYTRSSQTENRGVIVGRPVIQDLADFLMISMTIDSDFLPKFEKYHPLDDIEFKTSRYYGQVSADMRKSDKGLSKAVGEIAENFNKYLCVMKRFAHDSLDQDIVKEFIHKEQEFRKQAYDEKAEEIMDKYDILKAVKNSKTLNNEDNINKIMNDIKEAENQIKKLKD